MREVMIAGGARIEVIDRALKNGLGSKVVGASVGGGKLRAHLTDQSAVADESTARGILENYNVLVIQSDKNSIQADGSDTATITYSTAGSVDWVAYLDGQVYATGDEDAAGGLITLTLAVDVPGVYEVHVIERGGGFGTGFVQIGAV